LQPLILRQMGDRIGADGFGLLGIHSGLELSVVNEKNSAVIKVKHLR
jgi:hypothetical protein